MLVLSTGSLYKYGLNRIFQIAKEHGYEGIELIIDPDRYDTYHDEYIKELIKEYDMPVVGVATPLETTKAKTVRNALKLAESLNVPNLVVRPPFFTHFKFTNWFKTRLPKLQDRTKVNLCVVNVPAGKTFILPKFALGNINEMKRFSHMCLDTSHLVSRKIDLMRVYDLFKEKLSFIHLSNWHKGVEHWLPTEGLLPLESFLTKLAKDGYQGPIAMKLNLENLGSDDLVEVSKKLKLCKNFYDEYYTKSLKTDSKKTS